MEQQSWIFAVAFTLCSVFATLKIAEKVAYNVKLNFNF